MPIYHRNIQQNTPNWLRVRAGKVTASAIAKIVTPKELKLSKQHVAYMDFLLAEQYMGRPVSTNPYQTLDQERGHEQEQTAVDAFQQFENAELEYVGFVEREDRLIGCSPDRLFVHKNEGLEVKSPISPVQMGYLRRPQDLLDKYTLQCQFQCLVCGFDAVWLCSHNASLPTIVRRIVRDEAKIKCLSAAVDEFVSKMLDERLRLEKEYGPFPEPYRPDQQLLADGLDDSEFYLTTEDLPDEWKEFAR